MNKEKIDINKVIKELREIADSPFGRIKVDDCIQVIKDNIEEITIEDMEKLFVVKDITSEIADSGINLSVGWKEKSNKDIQGKLRWSLMPLESLEEVMKVIDFGANKYAPNTWQNNTIQECYDALFRHLKEWKVKDIPIDEESGLNHMAHVAANALMILYLYKKEVKE